MLSVVCCGFYFYFQSEVLLRNIRINPDGCLDDTCIFSIVN
ncbi:hypothetical protein YPPY66_2321 [Yersinia pestis PY-66]|uniref:Uncharacterized protein n=3 Tax=Yersinia pseudotuberculosis complex TaxID=1649845 RepID=A0A0U1QVN4_YERP3|nr:hypothetical protein YpsIP31758_2331 [Yersinia pseudotuberculosis IP 31758]EDR31979.1 hypothetical protein YPIP275_2170 [Yersinia pestis biovar Orientalis str. IP275]EDR39324.1 hypothetical protein YpF1991016_3802 [Yersinia pestis biovar Orientalis str. F1991016]EDR42601.1 hypothetical protein YpE1979001_4318 [Yersinia pestis biovar Antiqua str. E1979001]EDR52549.1 hypothetical protein YpB42003004_1168 [Yersinia pestis biovar Antiqua str. B42003004]EDR58173.1 hypothetical protein YpMG051020